MKMSLRPMPTPPAHADTSGPCRHLRPMPTPPAHADTSGPCRHHALLATLSLLLLFMLCGTSHADSKASAPPLVQLHGNIPQVVGDALRTGTRLDPQAKISIALTLPLRNKAEMDDLTQRLFDPTDPLYKHYLTVEEANSRFSPIQADYDAVVAFARSKGLNVTQTWQNRMLVDVSGPANVVEAAFSTHLMQYKGRDGRVFYAPDVEPSVPADIAPRLQGIIGLDNAAAWQTQIRRKPVFSSMWMSPTGPGNKSQGPRPVGLSPLWISPIDKDPGGGGGTSTDPILSTVGAGNGSLPGPRLSGPYGGLSPQNIRTAYNLNSVPSNGSGETIALVELNGFNPTDVQTYENAFGLPQIPLQIVSVDGMTNTIDFSNPHNDPAEVVLDIEMVAALAPGARQIRVYQGTFSNQGLLDVYNRIGQDTIFQTSCSFITPENSLSSSMKQSENNAFQFGTSTGNSFFAASGDWGPYAGPNSSNVTAGDPASQPWVCGVGGTTLGTDQYANYTSETTWNTAFSGSSFNASGGGISTFWAIPSWQRPLIGGASGASTSARNVPDISLNAYPNYSIYFNGSWGLYGGTSAASPLWAAFTALVNSRLNYHVPNAIRPIGQVNQYLYPLAQGARYNIDFHDIADGSNNGMYHAVPGYDLTTGLGSFNGANLFADLVSANGG